MVTRQIRSNVKKLIDGASDAAEGLGEQWADLLKQGGEAYCDLYKKAPQFIFNSPAGGFAQGTMNNLCEGRDGFEPPPARRRGGQEPRDLPFSGGQCEGNDYYVYSRTTICTDEGSWTELEDDTFINNDTVGRIEVSFANPSNDDWRVILRIYNKDGEETGVEILDSNRTAEKQFVESPPSESGCDDDGNYFVYVEILDVENVQNPDDDCGDPEEPEEPDQWEDPDDEPPETDVDIDIPPPQGYNDIPNQKINIIYNQDNRTYEGDKFTIKLEPPDIVFEYDDADPPDFLPDDRGDFLDNRPQCDPSDLIPDGLGDQFPKPNKFLRDLFDRISDLIPTPLPGVSVGDILDAIEDLEEGEGEEPQDFTFTVESCVEGEIEEEQITLSLLPSQEPVVSQVIEVRNRVERSRCALVPFEAVKITVVTDTVRGQARFGDTEQQTRKFFGWLQFTRDGEMVGDEVLIRYDPQIVPFHTRADDYLVQAIDGAELEDEVIPLD